MIGPKGFARDRESHICIEGHPIHRYRLPTSTNKYDAYILEYSVSMLMTFLLSFKVWFRHGFDFIHSANPPDLFFVVGLFYRLFGKKFIFDQHDLSPELFQVKFKGSFRLLKKFLLIMEKCSYRSAHLIIASNASQKRFAIERGHIRPEKIFIVRNGPDLNHFGLVPAEPELKGGRSFLLAYVGVMEVQDGVENCLYALHRLIYRRGRQDIALVLMGGGDH